MEVDQIRNIEDLIDLPPDKKILWHTVQRLTAPGENYGSLMLSVVITVKNRTTTEKIHLVAKMVPSSNIVQEIFNTQVTFKNEIAFYKNIVPLMQNFQRENGVEDVINFTAKHYGSRLNITGTDKADPDGALVLENLAISNYATYERTKGLDLKAAELVIENLAQFHAVPLALKLRKPEIYEKQIKPYMHSWAMKKEFLENMKKGVKKVVDLIGGAVVPLKDRILSALDKNLEEKKVREPWATMVHNDCWTNNNMFKMRGTEPIKSILVDFQTLGEGSPAADLVFFIFSSLKNEVIENNYDKLIRFYHNSFTRVLKKLKCKTLEFSFDNFLKEIDHEAMNSQFFHIIFMLGPIYVPKDKVKDLDEFSEEGPPPFEEVSDMHREKFEFVVKFFTNKNWI